MSLSTTRHIPALLILGAALCLPLAGQAQDAATQYQRDVTNCHINPDVDREACLKEAAAAAKAARENELSDPAEDTRERSRDSRCQGLTGTQRDECLKLMRDPDAEVQGSVSSGGILRKLTIPVPASGS